MKRILASMIILAVGVSAMANDAHCAVMTKNKVNVAAATKSKSFVDYKGKRYYFCCSDCIGEFKKSPAKYAKNGVAIPKKKKA